MKAWFATMLGLLSKVSDSVSVLEPHILWGARDSGQVFIRLGPDERIEHDAGRAEQHPARHWDGLAQRLGAWRRDVEDAHRDA